MVPSPSPPAPYHLSGGLIGNVLPPGALPVGEAKPLLSESSLAVIEAIGKQPSPPPAGGEPQPLTPVVVQENRPPRTISLLVSEPAPLVAPVELVARAGAKPPPTAELRRSSRCRLGRHGLRRSSRTLRPRHF